LSKNITEFIASGQDNIFVSYLPYSRIHRQASVNDSTYNKIVLWIGSIFTYIILEINKVFNGLFINNSTYLLDYFKRDYGLPNKIFYDTTTQETLQDIYVLKFLSKGNRAWNFQAIANVYGVDVKVVSGRFSDKESRLPNKIPHILRSHVVSKTDVINITFYGNINAKLLTKIKAIYAFTKQIQTTIQYNNKPINELDIERLKFNIGV